MAVLLDSYSETNQDATDDAFTTSPGPKGAGEAIALVTGGTLDSMKWYLRKVGTPTGNGFAKVYACSGTPGTNGAPTGAALATSDALDVSTLSTSFALITFNFSGANRITLSNSTNYALSFEYTAGNSTNKVNIGADSTSPSKANGNEFFDNSGVWAADNTFDECFYLYGADLVSTNKGSTLSMLGVG